MTRLASVLLGLVVINFSALAQDSQKRLEVPTDSDPKLNQQLRQAEQELCDAILHKDATLLNKLVGPEYTLRVSDVPNASLPRSIWMNNTIKRLKPESCDLQHNATRKLADDVGILSGIWSQKGSSDGRDFSGDFYLVDVWKKRGNWQIIARYSLPLGKPPERAPLQLPPAEDTEAQLTSVLTQRELELGQLALHGFKETKDMQRLVSADFTQRVSDAPERSLSRKQWGQPSGAYKIDSLEERYHSARKLSDDLAVVNLVLSQQASFEGRDRSGDFYVVDVWKKTGDGWQIVARYSGPIGKKLDR